MRCITAVALCLAISGCVSSGRYVGEKQLSQVVGGQTTERDLVRIIGEPMSRTYNSDGSQVVGWSYVRFGLFFGVGTKVQNVSLSLSPDGTVSGYSRSSSKPIAAAPIIKPPAISAQPASAESPLDKKTWQNQQLIKLQEANVSYEEYQKRYREIMEQ